MTEEQFEDFLKTAAQEYHPPPVAPRDEIWRRIQAAKAAPAAASQATGVLKLASRRPARRWGGGLLAAAALVAIGIGVDRLALTRSRAPNPATTLAANVDSVRANTMLRYAAVRTLSQVETLLTDYETDQITGDFQSTARGLLSDTRMLLGSPRLTDPRITKLLEDLELVLVQVARLSRPGQGDERQYIDQGMAERAIRHRLRSAIPAGPTA